MSRLDSFDGLRAVVSGASSGIGRALTLRLADEGASLALIARRRDALDRLAMVDDVKRQIVELRFFAGLGNDEAASVLGVSTRTVERGWRLARAWLRREIEGAAPAEGV